MRQKGSGLGVKGLGVSIHEGHLVMQNGEEHGI